MSHRILIVDDEPSICWALEKAFQKEGFQTSVAASAEEGLEIAASQSPSIVILDVRLPGMDGITAVPKFHSATGGAPVIVMTAFGDLETAVAAVQSGAGDYLTKPFKLEDVLDVCRRAIENSGAESAPVAQPEPVSKSQLVGKSSAMQHVFKQIALVAGSDLPVLITGETGTGKELVAEAIVRHSKRSDQPFLAVAPVALNRELLESELFGHVRGAFTGAVEDRTGYFVRAGGGTLLLDEIGDLPLSMQVKLLRVLEQQEITPVGDNRPRPVDVRILAATNSNLIDAVSGGSFREDLFHRLNGMHIHLPPLRERTEDIPLLCEHFLRRMDDRFPVAEGLSEQLVEHLCGLPWNGNVRELRNATEHAAIVARGRALTINDFPSPQPGKTQLPIHHAPADAVVEWTRRQMAGGDLAENLHERFLETFESALLREVLEQTAGNRVKAAELLGIHRGTLRERLKTYGDP